MAIPLHYLIRHQVGQRHLRELTLERRRIRMRTDLVLLCLQIQMEPFNELIPISALRRGSRQTVDACHPLKILERVECFQGMVGRGDVMSRSTGHLNSKKSLIWSRNFLNQVAMGSSRVFSVRRRSILSFVGSNDCRGGILIPFTRTPPKSLHIIHPFSCLS